MTAAQPTPRKFSLAQQHEAVRFARVRQCGLAAGQSIKGLRGKQVEEYDVERLAAVLKTLDWLMINEADIKAFCALPPAGRVAALEMAKAHVEATAK